MGQAWRALASYLWVAAGALLIAYGIVALLVPNKLLSGGVSGIALLANELLHVPTGAMIFALNVPIFALGLRDIGRRFAILSVLGVIALSAGADALPQAALTTDPLLAAIFGGILTGLGTAVALRGGGSTGGFDILGVVLNRRFGLGVSEVLLVLNGTLILVKGLLGTPELALYTLVSIYASSRTIEALQAARPRKAFLVITREAERIRGRIGREMRRGVTVVDVQGGYSGDAFKMLLVVVQRVEMKELQELINAEDRGAFVVVLEASDVMGYFRRQSTVGYWMRRAAAEGGDPPVGVVSGDRPTMPH